MFDRLQAVALGKSKELPRMRVLAALPRLAPTGARTPLVRVADDPQELPRMRTLAVSSLGRVKSVEVMADLKRYALDRVPTVAARAVQILGRIGDESALTVLVEVRAQASHLVRKRAVFSAALIAHRLGLRGYDLPDVRTASYLTRPATGIHVKLRAVTGDERSRVIASLTAHSLPMPTAVELREVECLKQHWALVIDRTALEPWNTEQFLARKRHLGQLAFKNLVSGEYAPGLSILMTPVGAGTFEVGLYRASGALIYGGTGRAIGTGVEFSLHAVERPGAAATIIEGAISPNGLDLKISTAARRSRARLKPMPARLG